MKNLYIYIISSGCYSGYNVNALMANSKRLNKDELKSLEDRAKVYFANNSKGSLEAFLIAEGFTVIYPTGEFHSGDYSGGDGGMYFSDDIRQGDENAFMLHLA